MGENRRVERYCILQEDIAVKEVFLGIAKVTNTTATRMISSIAFRNVSRVVEPILHLFIISELGQTVSDGSSNATFFIISE